jgi:hypothetical protein
MNQVTKRTVLSLLEELYETRGATALNRISKDLSLNELKSLEESFDTRFRRILNKIENLINLA